MKTRTEIEEMVLVMPQTVKDYPFGEDVAVYKIGSNEGKMFALIHENSMPVRLSLKCDPQLAELLREKYETIVPGMYLNKKHWNTVICTGQLDDTEMRDLIRHSYELVLGTTSENQDDK